MRIKGNKPTGKKKCTKFKSKALLWLERAPSESTTSEVRSLTTVHCSNWIIVMLKLLYLKHFSLTWMMFEVGGTVFIINSKIHWKKINFKAYFKAILHYFGVYSLLGLMVDGCMELKPAETINRQGKNQFSIGMPWCNKNSKVQILGKSKPLPVKSRSEMHFWIKHKNSAPQHLHSHLK